MANGDDTYERAGRARKGSPFLSTQQAAHYLGLRPKTLANMRWRGAGPRYRHHGGRVHYHIDDLEAWSQGREIRSDRAPSAKETGDA